MAKRRSPSEASDRPRRRARVEALEPRILLSADLPGLEAVLPPAPAAVSGAFWN